MDDAAVDGFLAPGGSGVLSLARGDEPYATPVSYAYDPDVRSFYLRLGFAPESEKGRFMDEATSARFVVYSRGTDGWTSVIASGTLERLDDGDLTADIASRLQRGDPPLVAMWSETGDAVEFRIYRLDPDRISGRRVSAE